MSREKIKVLHVVGGLSSRGGACEVALKMAGLAIPGYIQSVWVHERFPAENYPDLSFERSGLARCAHRSIAHDLLAGACESLALRRFLKEQNRLCILHVHTRMGAVAAILAACGLDLPVVMHLHHFARKAGLYRYLFRSGRVVPVSNSQRTREYYRLPESSPVVHPFITWPIEPPSVENNLIMRFITASEIVPLKKIDKILDAWDIIQRRSSEAEMVVYGFTDTPYDRYFSDKMRKRLNSTPCSTAESWNGQWWELVRDGDVYVHLCDIESFGLSVLQAFAMGMKLVVCNGTFLDSLPAEVSGVGIYRIDGDSPDCVAEAMIKARDARISAGELQKLRSAVAVEYSEIRCAETIKKVYDSLVCACFKFAGREGYV